jgi:ATP-dependent RNA helicase DOB1
MTITDEPTVKDYHTLRQQLDSHTRDMRDVIMHPNYCLSYLQAGRVVKVKFKDHDFGWGAIVNVIPRGAEKGEVLKPQESFVAQVLLVVSNSTGFVGKADDGLPAGLQPPRAGEKGKMEVVPVLLTAIDSIGHLRIFLPKEVKSTESKNTVRKSLDEVKKRFPDGIAILDPIENMNIKDDSFKKLLRVRLGRPPARLLLILPENRSPRITTSIQPTAQLSAASRTLQSVRKEGGTWRQDQEHQEGDSSCTVDHSAGRAEEP